jgi:hypothetical protein
MGHFGGLVFREIQQNLEEISAMMDVYAYLTGLTENGDLDEKEAGYLLSLGNPIKALHDRWLYEGKDISESLNRAFLNLREPERSDENEDDEWEAQ